MFFDEEKSANLSHFTKIDGFSFKRAWWVCLISETLTVHAIQKSDQRLKKKCDKMDTPPKKGHHFFGFCFASWGFDSNGFPHIQLQKFLEEFTPPNSPEFVQFTLHIQGKKTIGSSYDTLDSIGWSWCEEKNPPVFQVGFYITLKIPTAENSRRLGYYKK